MRDEAYTLMRDLEESYWWYRVRREIILDTVFRFVPREARLLDYGSGNGATAARLAASGYQVTVTDSAQVAIDVCHARGLDTVAIDDLQRESCDGILACDVLEHIEDEERILGFFRGLLSPGGSLIVTVPAYEFLWSGEDYVSEHVRRYRRRKLIKVLESARFELIWSSHFNALLAPLVTAVILAKRLFHPRDLYRSNLDPLPPWLDRLLGQIFALERPWLRHLGFPWGTSLIAVCRKPL